MTEFIERDDASNSYYIYFRNKHIGYFDLNYKDIWRFYFSYGAYIHYKIPNKINTIQEFDEDKEVAMLKTEVLLNKLLGDKIL